ncbi:TIGR03915 family putative DNA repair protein [Geobacter sp. SVR]|uniref:TIGR03915 family putative DNA repair protein n=1 Tax=Geobacter sp. SVR TaxID=2495594 RepID=UPI00143EF6A6|nr:TIGR03915 family putative DNA repair protein [Geobacter sp. SVR]BCS53228.1 hypothetical protein GSVR_15360 [Geobacter sp. SVR]GCF84613.1 hypothetical protein GSbR_12130 [Geobacter sp. SVR]
MHVYRYDNSFEGFICAVTEALGRQESHPEFTGERNGNNGLFSADICEVPYVRETALAFRKTFVETVSQSAFAAARYAFHSRKEGIERLLWRYFKLGLEAGPRLALMQATEPVHTVERLARQVSHEAHKFKGFVRFGEVADGFLYAPIEPVADILTLIAPHFVGRIGDRPWMIHDLGRAQAVLFDLRTWRLVTDVELLAQPDPAAGEQDYAGLWQRYFQRLAIPERHNPELQRKHVPLRYRKQLTEFNSPAKQAVDSSLSLD